MRTNLKCYSFVFCTANQFHFIFPHVFTFYGVYANQLINWKLAHVGMNPTAEQYLVFHKFGRVSYCYFYLSSFSFRLSLFFGLISLSCRVTQSVFCPRLNDCHANLITTDRGNAIFAFSVSVVFLNGLT